MRVLHVYSGNLYGGIEAMLATLASVGPVVPPLVQEFALCFDGRAAAELRTAGAPVHLLGEVRVSRPASLRRSRVALTAVLSRGRFDRVVLHAPWSYALFAATARQAQLPIVFWAHDVMTGRHWTERLAARVAPDHVVCNSAFTRGTLAQVFRNTPATVVHPPVAAAAMPLSAGDRAGVRHSLDSAPDATVIATACRSEAWKGHARLIEALAQLRDVPGWVWWQIGGAQRAAERDYLTKLRELAEQCGVIDRVRWLGERTDVGRLLAAADIYCQPNAAPEPFGIAFVEALAAGLPVVTTDFGGAREIVDASCGVLVPAADGRALAGALHRLIGETRTRTALSVAAPVRARTLCDPPTQVERFAEVLSGIRPLATAGAGR